MRKTHFKYLITMPRAVREIDLLYLPLRCFLITLQTSLQTARDALLCIMTETNNPKTDLN
jgi:hypothetical protein